MNNQIVLNGDVIETNLTEEYVFQKMASSEMKTAKSSWVYYGTMEPNLRAEERIRTLSISVLAGLLLGAFGWPGSLIGAAQTIITTLVEADNDTKKLYCLREIYRKSDGYYYFKYYDDVYADKSYDEFLYSRTWEQYE